MQQNNISILSTRPVDTALLLEAGEENIRVDTLSFIETEPIHSIEVQQEIENALLRSATVVFTSMNAVEAVANELEDQQPDWKIYCIGYATRQLVTGYFGESAVWGTADSATALAELIAEEEPDEEVIFFCGDQRRDELPAVLKSHDIGVTEIVVYRTITVSHRIDKPYHGILFFSPSAVDSFFLKNKVPAETIFFAIGSTTASAIKKHSTNKIIISDEPGKENLFRKMMEYFT